MSFAAPAARPGLLLPPAQSLLDSTEKAKEKMLDVTGVICGGRGGIGRRLEAWLCVNGNERVDIFMYYVTPLITHVHQYSMVDSKIILQTNQNKLERLLREYRQWMNNVFIVTHHSVRYTTIRSEDIDFSPLSNSQLCKS